MVKNKIGLYDSDTEEALFIEKEVDLSELAPKSAQLVVRYTTSKRGRIAQIQDRYEVGLDVGRVVHYFLDETSAAGLASDDVFVSLVQGLGGVPSDLANQIFHHS